MNERLARYWCTCIEGTAFEPRAQKIRHGVKGSLFESRWGEVLQFVRFLVDVLPLMASSWDARSYKSYAEAREAQSEAQQRAEQRAGIAQFNPDQLTRTLHSAFVQRFCLLLVRVEAWPSKLAAFGAGCPCHSALVRHASPRGREDV